jgi:hypothetical protein
MRLGTIAIRYNKLFFEFFEITLVNGSPNIFHQAHHEVKIVDG